MAHKRKSTGPIHETVHRSIGGGWNRRRLTFQLEGVYNDRGNGPYGPYWYVYFSKRATRPGPRGGRPSRPGFTKVVSRYVGKPEAVTDPRDLTEKQLAALVA